MVAPACTAPYNNTVGSAGDRGMGGWGQWGQRYGDWGDWRQQDWADWEHWGWREQGWRYKGTEGAGDTEGTKDSITGHPRLEVTGGTGDMGGLVMEE